MAFGDTYLLDAQCQPVACDAADFVRWYAHSYEQRRVADVWIGGVRISTVFLGTDRRHWGDLPPLLWETMVYGSPYEWEELSASLAEAIQQHERAVEWVQAGCPGCEEGEEIGQ